MPGRLLQRCRYDLGTRWRGPPLVYTLVILTVVTLCSISCLCVINHFGGGLADLPRVRAVPVRLRP